MVVLLFFFFFQFLMVSLCVSVCEGFGGRSGFCVSVLGKGEGCGFLGWLRALQG